MSFYVGPLNDPEATGLALALLAAKVLAVALNVTPGSFQSSDNSASCDCCSIIIIIFNTHPYVPFSLFSSCGSSTFFFSI